MFQMVDFLKPTTASENIELAGTKLTFINGLTSIKYYGRIVSKSLLSEIVHNKKGMSEVEISIFRLLKKEGDTIKKEKMQLFLDDISGKSGCCSTTVFHSG